MKHSGHNRGFIALMSVIIISAILLMLVFSVGVSSFLNRFDALDIENKRVSLGLAEACVSVAMLRLALNPTTYGGGEVVTVDTSDAQRICKICSFSPGVSQPTVPIKAQYNGAYSNLSITMAVTGTHVAMTSWIERASNSTCTVP
jgi:hypothetical protein